MGSLVVISGKPSCGKTKVANLLKDYICSHYPDKEVIIVSDVGISRNDVYCDSRKEITSRGAFKSAVDRTLSKRPIVIADSLNYIKGFRYELHCIAKYARVTYCVIHVDASNEDIFKFNDQKEGDQKYSDDILNELIMRFEEPNSMARWDSPLFYVNTHEKVPCLA